jgi:hypothetical protein
MNTPNAAKSAPANRSTLGPFDYDEVAEHEFYGDFGAILLKPVDGLDIRLEMEEASGKIIAVALTLEQSNLNLRAYAAPKNTGLWHEVRAEQQQSIVSQGGVAEERLGSFGPELLAQVPELVDGKIVGHKLARFLGIDGPRWFLRCVVSGAAVTDPAAASRIEGFLRSLVINRGLEPVPPGELLEPRVPASVVAPPRSALGY